MRITFCQRILANGRTERPEVVAELRDMGHEVVETDDAALELENPDLVWIQGNANWYPQVCQQLTAIAAAERPPVVIWHTEPLPPPPLARNSRSRLHLREIAKILLRDRRATDPSTNAGRLRRLNRAGVPNLLVVSTGERQDYLAAKGVQSHFVPLGYHAPTHGRDLHLQRDIELLFLGIMDVPRRRRLVSALARAGVTVRTEGSWHGQSTWGDARTEMLNRTRILLNLQRHPGELSGLRMILGMANGALVISEPIDRPDPYVPGEHYVEAPLDELPSVIRHYLDHPQERQRIVEAARHFVTGELTLVRSLQRILDLVDAYRARTELKIAAAR